MTTPPFISIITSTLNAAKQLPRLAASIHAQQSAHLEWIVIDGGSTDGTLDLLRSNALGVTRWISEPDRGIYDAWNKGLALARGEWIAFLGADDELVSGAIEAMLQAIASTPAFPDFICGRVEMAASGSSVTTIGRPWAWSIFRRYMCVAHTGALHHASYFERFGTFDSGFKISGDYELLLRAGAELKTSYIGQVLVRSELGGVSNCNPAVFTENFRAKRRHKACGWLEGRAFMAGAWFMWALRRRLGRWSAK